MDVQSQRMCASWRNRSLCCSYTLVRFGSIPTGLDHPTLIDWALGTTASGDEEILGVWPRRSSGQIPWWGIFQSLSQRGVESVDRVALEACGDQTPPTVYRETRLQDPSRLLIAPSCKRASRQRGASDRYGAAAAALKREFAQGAGEHPVDSAVLRACNVLRKLPEVA